MFHPLAQCLAVVIKHADDLQIPLVFGRRTTKSVIDLMEQGNTDKTNPIDVPPTPQCVSSLHLEMYLLADKYDIAELGKYAFEEYQRWLHREGAEGCFATVESYGEIPDTAKEVFKDLVLKFAW